MVLRTNEPLHSLSTPLADKSALILSREGTHSDDQYIVPEGE